VRVSFVLLFGHLIHRLSTKNLDRLAMVAHRIWLRWNSLVFEDKFIHPNTVFSKAASACEEFYRCNLSKSHITLVEGRAQTPVRPWQPPPQGMVKINWDASLNKKSGCIGFGCVACDSIDSFLGAKCT
jgi:hypothetical protein